MRDNPDKSRRQILTAAGVGVVTALAGCSGNGSGGEGEPPPEDGDQPDSETQTEQSTDTESTTEHTTSDQATGKLEDTAYEGEEAVEEIIGSWSDYDDDAPDNHWIEFENPTEQINIPVESAIGEDRQFNYFVENGSFAIREGGEEYDIDAMYLTFPETGLEESPEIFAFSEEAWDENASLEENFTQNVYRRAYLYNSNRNPADISEDLETLFSEDVQAYNDASEDFPQEYLNLVDQ